MALERIEGRGWIALLGGGEFSFGQTEEADRAWLAHAGDGPVGFVPAASGSTEYGGHLAAYFAEKLDREVETIPVYRARDARRGKNCRRLAECAAVYLGGGVVDHLLAALTETPAAEALAENLRQGGVIVAIAAAAQALGQVVPLLLARDLAAGLGWLRSGVVVANFDPRDERRLRELVDRPDVRWGLGIPAGSAVLLGPDGEVETVGEAFVLDEANGELETLTPNPLDKHFLK